MKKVFTAAVVLPVLVALLAVSFALWADRHVGQAAAGRMFDDLDNLPKRDVALVLGTSKYANGRINTFYAARIRAAAELYQGGKVDGILVSGDNGRDDYKMCIRDRSQDVYSTSDVPKDARTRPFCQASR